MQSKRLQRCIASSELRNEWKPCIPSWGAENKAMFHRLYALGAFKFVDKRKAQEYRSTRESVQTGFIGPVALDNLIGLNTYNVVRIHKDVLYLARMMRYGCSPGV